MSSWDLVAQARRRLAEENGTLRKQASTKIALCYPSTYEVAMSSLGYQVIYREMNLHPDAAAERGFLPDSPEECRKSGAKLISYESETPLADFPIVAFSMAYELEIVGLFEVLDLAGIPLQRNERTGAHPLILLGGPLTNSNPLPLAPFADVIILGEAEELIHQFLEAARELNRADLLSHLSRLPGCYIPGSSGDLPTIAKVSDEKLPAFSQILTRNTILSSMFLIEAERGCSRGCTYCVMRRTTNGGMRLVAPSRIQELIPEHAKRVGLVGAAVTDHPEIRQIVRGIVDSGRGVSISSLRADRLDAELVELLARGGYRTLTTAADGASQRLRNEIDRKTSEKHLIRAAELARRFRLQRLKLYEMVGLPGETDADIDELILLSRQLATIIPLSLGISPFVPKRYTPLDGAPFEAVASIELKLARLREGLRGKVEIRPTSARWAWVEYMLAQSGEDAGLAAWDAWRAGGSYGAWKRAFTNRAVRTFPYRRAIDGRRRHSASRTTAPAEVKL